MIRNERFYKLLLIGDNSVGKSAIQQRYVADIFLSTVNPLIGMLIKYITICTV